MRSFFAFLSGGLFGAGLLVSGMVDTKKVQGWLDIFGSWDPTLAFVMGGAVSMMAVVWIFARKRETSLLGSPMPGPFSRFVDRNLVLGSLLFGAGWGLAGLCPGPAMASLSFNGWEGWLFLIAMGLGMAMTPRLKIWLSVFDRPTRDAPSSDATPEKDAALARDTRATAR